MNSLQTTFYILGIVYMTINVLILIGIGAAIFVLIKKVMEIHHLVDTKIHQVSKLLDNPSDTAADLGASFAAAAFTSIKNKIFTPRSRR